MAFPPTKLPKPKNTLVSFTRPLDHNFAMNIRWIMRFKTSLMGICLAILWCIILSQKFKENVCDSSSIFAHRSFCSTSSNPPEWDLFYHLGGNGPWIPKLDGLGNPNTPLPTGCIVDQAHMLSRHAERYPTRNAGNRHLGLLQKLQKPEAGLRGSLSFLKSWSYFTDPKDPAFEGLVKSGPYSGIDQAYNTGTKLRLLYDHLVQKDQRTRFWSSSAARAVDTAKHFADGFFGSAWEADGSAQLQVIPETAERGGDTLTPGDTCYRYRNDAENGHDYGYSKLEDWQKTFASPIVKRLAKEVGDVVLSPLDIYSMMEMCGFEILARGSSPWCNVFTHEEWLQFEYARDLLHFYRAGPGNQYSGAMGWLWLNAVNELMLENQTSSVFFSFAHDGDIIPLLATLQIYDEHAMLQDLPTNRMKKDRQWRTSDVVPMGGRIIFERLACGTTGDSSGIRRYVRVFINDGLVSFPGVPSVRDIRHAMALKDFNHFVSTRQELFGEFKQICKLGLDVPAKITFLHQ